MNEPKTAMHIQEFSRRTGVTVRTLHHYDRLGLLEPAGRTAVGYRLYGEAELVRLQQIVTLKFIGCSLGEIKAILAGSSADLQTTFALQREALQRRRRVLDRAIMAVEQAQEQVAQTGKADWNALRQIIEVVEMDNDKTWMRKYYTQEQIQELASRDPKLKSEGEAGWAELIPRIEAAAKAGVDPASDEARALLERQQELIQMFTGGNPGIQAGLEKLYADKANWPTSFKSPFSQAAQEFLGAAKAAHSKACR